MKDSIPSSLFEKSEGSLTGGFARAWVGAAVLVMAALQVGCIDTPNFSPAAAIATFAPADLPLSLAGEITSDADFGTFQPTAPARQLANSVLHSRDHTGADFIIVDKSDAMLYVFGSSGTLRGATAVLLGLARGDDSVPDIGTRPMDQVRPEERTTPAGRFMAERGVNTMGEDVVWVDYDAAVSMHRVRATHPKEKRLERLATPSADDNRISYGCINMPVVFFETLVAPMFAGRQAVVYILPETKLPTEVFSFYESPKRN